MSSRSLDFDAEEMRHFKSYLCANASQFSKPNAIRLVGSFAELFPTFHDCHVSEFDVDVMIAHSEIIALPPSYPNPEKRFRVIDIEPNTEHPGFARLINRHNGQRLTWDCLTNRACTGHPLVERYKKYGPSEAFDFTYTKHNNWHLIPLVLNAEYCDRISDTMFITGIDRVPYFRCPVWPDQAAEWVTRTRRNGWPSQSLIDQCVRTGCAFVTKAPTDSKDPETEFRYSFSFAEVVLVRSWLPTQKYIYNTLKQMAKSIGKRMLVKNVLCSYYIKTEMFWACEEKGIDFWEKARMQSTVSALLCELIVRIIDGKLPHYFIPRFNIIRDCVKDVPTVVEVLQHLIEDVQRVSYIGTLSTDPQVCYLSANVIFFMHITCGNPKVLTTALMSETVDLYSGIKEQLSFEQRQKNVRLEHNDVRWQQYVLSEAKMRLHEATKRCDKLIKLTLLPGEDALSAAERLSTARSEPRLPALSKHSQRCTKSTSIPERLKISDRRNQTFATNECGLSSFFHETFPEIEQRLGTFKVDIPTVLRWLVPKHFSWQLASAHLANLYYKTLKQYDEAIRICDDTLDFIESHFAYRQIYDSAFSVALSSRWSPIFDSTVQALHGLVVLDDFLKNGPSTTDTVIVKLCPVVLVHFIRIRCLRVRGNGERVLRTANELLRQHLLSDSHMSYHHCGIDDALVECVAYGHPLSA